MTNLATPPRQPPSRTPGGTAATDTDATTEGLGYSLVRAALTLVALILAAGSLAPAWNPMPVAWVALVVTAIIAAALVWALRRVGLVGFVAALVALAVPIMAMVLMGRSMGRGAREALTRPFPELLTTAAPAPVTMPLLLPGLVLAWLVGVAVGLATGLRAGRNTSVFGGLAAGLVLYVAAQLLSGGESDRFGLIAGALVLTWLADWSLWTRATPLTTTDARPPRGGAGPDTGRGLVRALVVAAVFALIAAGGALVNLGEPFRPQELIERNDVRNSEPNPMPLVSQWAREPQAELFRRSGDAAVLHLSVLTEYDGVTFRPPERPYDPVGGARPPTPPLGGEQSVVRTNVVWPQQTRWLPAPGQPQIVSLPDAEVNPHTGTLITREVPQEGSLSYSVTSVVSRPDPAALPHAPVPDLPDYLGTADMPQEMRAYGAEIVGDLQSPFEKAKALEAGIKNNRDFTSELPAGNSYGRLTTFLLASPEDGGRAGTSEQFAVAFAVLARSQGLPTRVVVGFGPGTPEGDGGTAVVHGSDALAWPEVYFQGQGWVPFNPTPDTEEISPVAAEPPDQQNTGVGQQDPDSEQQTPPDAPEPEQQTPWLWLLVPLLVVVLVVAAGLVARGVRRARQRRRGAVGAWDRVVDAVGLAGWRFAAHQTARQRAAALASDHDLAQDVAARAGRLARAAETQAFAPDAASGPTSAAMVEDVQRIEQAVRAEAAWWRRMVWPLTPQPFWRRWR